MRRHTAAVHRFGSAKWLLALLALASLGGVAAASEIAPGEPGRGIISVTGSGVVWAEPDQAVVELGWSGVETEAGAAVAEASDAVASIRAAIEALGVDPLDVRTTGYFVWREERWDDRGEPRLIGYRVSHTLQVVVRDVDVVGTLISTATAAGANQVGGVTFTVAERGILESEARAAAFEAARQRAVELAALAGLRLGPAIEVEEVSRSAPGIVEPMLDMAGLGGAPVAAGRHAVEVVVRVTFAGSERRRRPHCVSPHPGPVCQNPGEAGVPAGGGAAGSRAGSASGGGGAASSARTPSRITKVSSSSERTSSRRASASPSTS
jgi:uncharacterized protein